MFRGLKTCCTSVVSWCDGCSQRLCCRLIGHRCSSRCPSASFSQSQFSIFLSIKQMKTFYLDCHPLIQMDSLARSRGQKAETGSDHAQRVCVFLCAEHTHTHTCSWHNDFTVKKPLVYQLTAINSDWIVADTRSFKNPCREVQLQLL